MGKSLKNSVSPDDFSADYGMDTLRLYEMFMGPLDASKPWTTRDIVGIVRFLQRVWRSLIDPDTDEVLVTEAAPSPDLNVLLHRTIKAVTDDMAALRFNTAVARFFELNNAMVGLERVPREVAEALVRMLAPFAPHVSEELWERLGHQPSVAHAPWPDYDADLARQDTVTMIVQVNGKVRDRIEVSAGISEDEARALALGSEKVKAYLSGAPVKVIVRPPVLVNVVVR
jgi:leucyl-tRNA synthetase